MCRRSSIQKGVPLNEMTLSEMSKEERKFWEDFLEEAKQIIDKKEAKDGTKPFRPPLSLKRKYREAITKYDGGKYCQIRQLQEIFAKRSIKFSAKYVL